MDRAAVFVDAGYLIAAGAAAIAGSKKPRTSVGLGISEAFGALKSAARAASDSVGLLRIYWYDGLLITGLTTEQTLLAEADDVKLRLGVVNKLGKQKGVDSLIVADLIALARNHAISDAILVSGDEDVRIGVEVAQGYGVRVHPVGVEPGRASQSVALRQEADTNMELKQDEVRRFLSFDDGTAASEYAGESNGNAEETITAAVAAYIDDMDANIASNVRSVILVNSGIPREHDGRLLAACRRRLGRDLEENERLFLRKVFKLKLLELQ